MNDHDSCPIFPPAAPTIPPLPMEYIVLVGAINTTLDCRGTGDPLPDLAWVKDDLILPITGQHVCQSVCVCTCLLYSQFLLSYDRFNWPVVALLF